MRSPFVQYDRTRFMSGPYNMALDQVLFDSAEKLGRHAWRLYKWDPPAVSIGRNQQVRKAVNRDFLSRRGIALIRRPTGGRAIWHAGDFCFTHAGFTPHEGESISAFRSDYMRAAGMVVRFLDALGIEASISPGRAGMRTPAGLLKGPCFQSPGRYEVLVHEKKVAGIAQYRSGCRFLIQGSIRLSEIDSMCRDIFFEGDQTGTEAFEDLRSSVTSLEQELRREVDWDELIDAFLAAIDSEVLVAAEAQDSDVGVDLKAVHRLREKRYCDSGWNEKL